VRKGRIRRAFPGNNTSEGFFSFFEYIIGPEARKVFIIKGGPGTGKSTFMKNIGMELVDRGYDVEFFHCASDNDSLDAVAVPAVGAAIIDGTAPHRVVSAPKSGQAFEAAKKRTRKRGTVSFLRPPLFIRGLFFSILVGEG